MSTPLKSILILGASGNIGRHILTHLLASTTPVYTISVLTRSTSTSIFPDNVNVIRASYDYSSLLSAFKSQDCIISCIATSNLTDQKMIIDAAVDAGVKRFVPSEFGWDTSDKQRSLEVAPCTAMKIDVVEYLRGKEESGMEWTGVVTGLWLDAVSKMPEWPWWSIGNKTMVIFDGGEVPFEWSSTEQVARTIITMLKPENLEATKNWYVFTHSGSMTQNQLLSLFEKECGAKWTITEGKVEDVNRQGKEMFQRLTAETGMEDLGEVEEFGLSVVLMITSGCFGMGEVNQFEEKAKYWMEKLGLEEESAEEVVRGVIKDLGASS